MLFPPVQIFVLVAGHLVGSTSARPASTRPEPTAEHRDSQNNLTTRTRGYDIPIRRGNFKSSTFRRRGSLSGESGLGDNSDLLYTVPIEVGSTVVAVNLDTGSSDLWIVSDACNTDACKGSTVTRYPTKNANSSGIDVNMLYGDSSSGTFAKGTIGLDTATIAGIAMTDQAFGMVNDTDNPVVKYDTAGIFGLGFPAGSNVQQSAVVSTSGPINATDDFLLSTYTQGPLLSRILMTDALESPMFTITLHRNTIDISGKGQLTVGKLPDGVDNSSLTWVPVRLYNPDEGGLRPPTFAPNEIYPFRWEVDIDAVYLDGTRLPASTVPTSDGVDATRTSALIDTGNSIIRGPQDVVGTILRSVSPSYQPQDTNPVAVFPCNTPHTLSFQIGGQLFPIDPRDFVSQYKQNDATTCVADNLVTTDAPQFGALFRWSLGDPFFKSNLIAFHYGNLTHPSVDPPRIGFLSLVPPNVGDLYQQAVNNALSDGGNFEETINPAPTASAASAPQVTVSAGSEPDVTHLSAAATLTLSAATIPTSSSPPEKSNSALSNNLSGRTALLFCTIGLSWMLSAYLP